MLEILTARKSTPAPADYMLNRLRAAGALSTLAPLNLNPGTAWDHNGVGSIALTGGKLMVGTSSAFPPSYLIAAAKDFEIRFNLYPTDQNESILMGDLINYEGALSWAIILNRKAGNISSVEFVVNDATTQSTRVFSFYLGTKLPINTWSDIVLKRVSGSLTGTINGTLRGTHSWNNASRKTGNGIFTIGRSADILQATEAYLEPFRGYLNGLYIDIKPA